MHNFQGVYVLDCQVKMLSSSSEYCYNQLSFLDSLVKVEALHNQCFFGSLASAAANSSFTVRVQTIFALWLSAGDFSVKNNWLILLGEYHKHPLSSIKFPWIMA